MFVRKSDDRLRKYITDTVTHNRRAGPLARRHRLLIDYYKTNIDMKKIEFNIHSSIPTQQNRLSTTMHSEWSKGTSHSIQHRSFCRQIILPNNYSDNYKSKPKATKKNIKNINYFQEKLITTNHKKTIRWTANENGIH